jgi:hypothetical protein
MKYFLLLGILLVNPLHATAAESPSLTGLAHTVWQDNDESHDKAAELLTKMQALEQQGLKRKDIYDQLSEEEINLLILLQVNENTLLIEWLGLGSGLFTTWHISTYLPSAKKEKNRRGVKIVPTLREIRRARISSALAAILTGSITYMSNVNIDEDTNPAVEVIDVSKNMKASN